MHKHHYLLPKNIKLKHDIIIKTVYINILHYFLRYRYNICIYCTFIIIKEIRKVIELNYK